MTINCAERGFLLVRVRDEIKMSIQAYQTLYESSVAYGMRKALQAEQRKAESLLKIRSLEDNNDDLDSEVEDLKRKINKMLDMEKQKAEQLEEEHSGAMGTFNSSLDVQKKEL